MDTGRRRHRCAFERRDTTPDAYGNVSDGWAALVTVWGGLRVERGRERLEAGRPESAVGGVLEIRSSTATRAITAADRVTIGGDIYTIDAITNPDRRDRFLEMTVQRGVATQ